MNSSFITSGPGFRNNPENFQTRDYEYLPGDELVFKGSADCDTSCGLSPASSNRVDNNLCLIASNCNDIDLMVGGGLTWR